MTVNNWVLSGDELNWKQSFGSRGIWGVRPNLQKKWEQLQENDRALFYCTRPVSRIIGHGVVRRKFRQNSPFWPDEVRSGRVIYPFRFEFDVEFAVEDGKWQGGGLTLATAGLTTYHVAGGLNRVRSDEIVRRVAELFTVAGRTRKISPNELTHENVKQMLFELGKIQHLIADKEYSMDRERLDVVWRRIERSVPTYAFEVQVGGDVYHALGKLKHAHDLWNSRLFLAISDKDIEKAKGLLTGTYHEINKEVTLLRLEDVKTLYQKKKEWKEFEESLGIN